MTNYRHYAANYLTGEVIACATGNQLKRSVANCARYDREAAHAWLFSHNGRPSDKVLDCARQNPISYLYILAR